MAGSRFKFVKYKIDEIDENNCTCKYSLIDGDMLGDKLETIKYEVKFEASGEGSVCKSSSHYCCRLAYPMVHVVAIWMDT